MFDSQWLQLVFFFLVLGLLFHICMCLVLSIHQKYPPRHVNCERVKLNPVSSLTRQNYKSRIWTDSCQSIAPNNAGTPEASPLGFRQRLVLTLPNLVRGTVGG